MARDATTADDHATITDDPQSAACSAVDKDTVFHLLQNSRRRAVVRYFTEFDRSVEIGDLAEQVAAWECGTQVEDITEDQRQRVYIALYQSHLDKLDDNEVVDYDEEEGTITAGPALADLRAHLGIERAAGTSATSTTSESDAVALGSDSVWASGYLGIALGGFVPVSGRLLDIGPENLVSLEILNLILVATCIVLATIQFLYGRSAEWSPISHAVRKS